MMIRTFSFLLILISAAFCADKIEKQCRRDENCSIMKTELLDHVNNWTNPCSDIHSYMCSENKRFALQKPLEERMAEIKMYLYLDLYGLLSSPLNDTDSDLLIVEKKLYQSCMLLDNERLQHERYYSDLKSELDNLEKSENWKHIENKLFSLGFGFSFFGIKVIPHPEHESRNTILLQPQSLEYLNSLTNKLQKIIGSIGKFPETSIHELYHFLNVTDSGKVLHFFETLKQAKIGLLGKSSNFQGYYTTLGQLKEKHVQSYYNDEPIKVQWVEVIQDALHRENIEFDTDGIVLKNPHYFLHMSKLLDETPSDVITLVVKTKLVTDSLPYTNWETANSLENKNMSEFCLKETKLYGASRRVVHDWILPKVDDEVDDEERDEKYIKLIYNFKKGETIFESVMITIQDEIALYKSHPSTKTFYYLRKLFHIIDNLSKYVYEAPYNIYENLDLSSNSHFSNILEYRKLVASYDLQQLKNTFDITRPFSVIDQGEPQNRFILNTILNVRDMHSPNLPKQMHYGTFGVRTAGLIHSLLSEDTFNDDYDVQIANTRSLTYPRYSQDVELCVSSKLEMGNYVGQIDDTITQVLALNTAYKALEKDKHIPFHSISNTLLSEEHVTSEKLFFLAYVQDNCGVGQEIINRILSHNQLFVKSFECHSNAREDEKTCMLGKLNY